MRKTYLTTDGNKIRKTGREKKVYYNGNGEPYFLWKGRREKFEEIPRLNYPVMYEDERGKLGVIGGYITLCNWGGVLVEILDGEAVQLWEELNE